MSPAESSQEGKILLVDDHGVVRRGIKTLLHLAAPGMQVDEASSVDEAVQRLGADDYVLSIIDLDLASDQSGLDLLKIMRQMERGLPAIILSGHADRDTVMRCLEMGASGFIPKASEDESVLLTALESVLAGRVYLPSSALGKGGQSTPFSLQGRSATMHLDELMLKAKLKEVLMYLFQGLSNKEIGQRMHISEFTARDYCSELYREFGVSKRAQLVVELARRGIVMPQRAVTGHASPGRTN